MENASLSLAQPQTFGSTEETARGIAPILKPGVRAAAAETRQRLCLSRPSRLRARPRRRGRPQPGARCRVERLRHRYRRAARAPAQPGWFETHGTPLGLASWRRREGTLPTYQLAFLMADYLIERRGLGGVEARFRSFSSSRDRNKNFALAFGTT